MISAQWVISPPTGKAEIGRERKMSVSVAKSVAIVRNQNQNPEKKGRKEEKNEIPGHNDCVKRNEVRRRKGWSCSK